MLAALPWILAAAAAVWAHTGRANEGANAPKRAIRLLALFTGSLLAWRALDLAIHSGWLHGGGAAALVPRALLALAAWTAVIGLVGVDRRRAGLLARVILLAGSLGTGLTGAGPGTTAGWAIPAVLSTRWMAALPTRTLLRLVPANLALLVLLGWRLPSPAAAAALAPLERFTAWSYAVAFGYAVFGLFALLAALARDPTLGIRRVARRLALSHVLVVVVPLTLTAALWVATTVLGVGADRATLAVRLLAAEGRALRVELSAGLGASGPPAAALARWAPAHAEHWPRATLWTGRDTTWAAAGEAAGSATLARAWADSLDRLPASALLAIGDSIYVGAAVRTDAGAAVVLVPLSTLLPRGPARLAHARLTVDRRLVRSGGGAIVIEPGDAAPPRPEAAQRRRGANMTLSAGRDTFAVREPSFLAVLRDGHALAQGLAWRPPGWRPTRFLVTASVQPSAAIGGLVRDMRENPVGGLPVILIGFLAVLAALVVLFDLVLVTNMGRSIATAIHALRGGAERLEARDLAHRVRVEGDDDLWDVAAALNTATAGLERGRAIERERDRFESELGLARQIQARLLPGAPPHVPGLELAGLSVSAREVGGDWYDHLEVGDGRALLVIADVSGKGVPASLLMSGVRASLLSQDLARIDAPRLAERLNEFVARSVEPGRFVTAFLAFVDPANDAIEYVNAGHNPPLIVRADGGHETLEVGGLILGVSAHARFERGVARLAAGDLLVLYTDGVTEAANEQDELWGEERLLETVRTGGTMACRALIDTVAARVRVFEGTRGPADDVTLLAARRVARG